MQRIFDPRVTVEQYATGVGIQYPVFDECPICGARAKLIGHGSYDRNALPSLSLVFLLAIKRLLCPVCHRTVSLLPWFLLPRYQYSLRLIIDALVNGRDGCRQLVQHWRRHFLRNVNAVLSFLRDLGYCASLPRAPDEKAIRLLRTIENMGPTIFSVLYHKRFRRSFMAP